MIDGKGQTKGPSLAQAPLADSHFKITETFDYASNSFDQFIDMEGKAKHTRVVFYVRNEFWMVVDKVETDRPRKIDALWHWYPDNMIKKEGTIVKTTNERGNLALIPIGKQALNVEFIKGQEEPEIQGWYSPEYNVYEPNITSSYTTNIDSDTSFVWLLMPSEKGTPKIKTKIKSENEQEITVRVTTKDKKWLLTIPFCNSGKAKLSSTP